MSSNVSDGRRARGPHPPSKERLMGEAFRGSFLNSYSQLERHITIALLIAAEQAECRPFLGKLPNMLSGKAKALRRLGEVGAPWNGSMTKILPWLDQIQSYDDIRNTLAHGVLDAKGLAQDVRFDFRMICRVEDKAQERRLRIYATEAKDLADRIQKQVNRLVPEIQRCTGSKQWKPSYETVTVKLPD